MKKGVIAYFYKKQLKYFLSAFFCFFFSFIPRGNSQSWLWARGAVGTGWGTIATDDFGYIYSAGAFGSSFITFDGVPLINGGTDSTEDIFIVKYDTVGNVIWAKRAGGTGYDATDNITVDAAGYIYMSGFVASHTAIFDTITLTYLGTTDHDMFVSKYDSIGNVVWAKNFGGGGIGGDIDPESISVDALGDVYVSGIFSSESVTFGGFTLINSVGAAMFLVKFSPAGEVIWAKVVQGAAAYYVSGAVDTMGHIYVTGTFSGSVSFASVSLVSQGSNDIFLAKYDSLGTLIWAKDAGGPDAEYGNEVTTDISGNVYITGFFDGPSLPFGSDTLINNYSPSSDNYIAKYDSSGNVMWARNAIGPGISDVSAIRTDNSGNVYDAGGFTGATITFGSDTLRNINPGSYALFVTKYDASGSDLWAATANGVGGSFAGCLADNASGQLYVAGTFSSTEFTMGTTTLTGDNREQFFLARLDTAFNPYALLPGIARANIGLSISPNPNTGSFTLHISSSANEDATIVITNVLGEKIKEIATATNTATEIQIDAAPGLYFISATTVHGSQSAKVVLQ